MKAVTLLIVGAGDRGTNYARYALHHPDEARIVAVAEPRDFYRERLAKVHNIPRTNVFRDWRDLANRPRLADAVIIATQDALHAEPAIFLTGQGYHMLLEKPMAPNEADCRRIVAAVKASGIIFAVAHVLRYTAYTAYLKKILDDEQIGRIVCIQHMEPVGYWHQAHSFVRGNWRNERESSPMLLAKSCHDLDWIRYIMGVRCRAVSSFGSLYHFRHDNRPVGASDRCLECAVERTCPYSAKRIYLDRVERGLGAGWPVNIITPDPTPQNVLAALGTGPYGRCVYACDNDVVDNQVVNLLFEDGRTASFTMVAFTEMADRRTRIFGTHGELYGDGSKIHVYKFMQDRWDVHDTQGAEPAVLGGHGGGDYRIMKAFVAAVAKNDPSLILSGPDETLETHLMVFAAERARRENRVVQLELTSSESAPAG